MAAVLGLDASFSVMDAENPQYESESFDVLVTRNLTWTLPHLEKAYREWYRILRPGGVLVNFDADYSAALENEEEHELPENHAHKLVPDFLHEENEAITMEVGAYHQPRPQWDVQLLVEAGFERIIVDVGVYRRIYAEIDEFFNPTPIFTIAAYK
jgi:SAM-dependent methyltransferase